MDDAGATNGSNDDGPTPKSDSENPAGSNLNDSNDQERPSDPVSIPDQDDQSRSSINSQSNDPSSTHDDNSSKPLSKRQLRKLKKTQYWESQRQERRKEERHRRQQRKREALAAGLEPTSKRKRIKTGHRSLESESKITVAVDMSFDDYMLEKDMKKSLTQIQYSYSVNRRSRKPLKLFITSFNGKSRSIFDRTRGCVNWDDQAIRLKNEHFLDVFPDKEKIVYLTSESPNVLDTLEEEKIYVIGGLVDHNAQKGLCFRLAEEKGLKHARLPIDEYVVMKTRKVLTINHVFEIMLKYTESGDWEKSFFDVLPKRKEASKKPDI